VVRLTVPLGEPIDPEDVERTLAEHPEITTVFVTHNETSNGGVPTTSRDLRCRKSRGKMRRVDSAWSGDRLPPTRD